MFLATKNFRGEQFSQQRLAQMEACTTHEPLTSVILTWLSVTSWYAGDAHG